MLYYSSLDKHFNPISLISRFGMDAFPEKNWILASMTSSSEYHAHIYFSSETNDKAKELMNKITDNFSVDVGTFHEKLVGPHPCWSFQVKFETKMFGIFVPWLMENRNRLSVFIHTCTGDNLLDHTENVCWLGEMRELNLKIFD